MTERRELDAQITEDESSIETGESKLEAYTPDGEEQKESTIPISELRKVRAEAAKYRKELQSLKSKLVADQKDSEQSKMEETERLKSIATESEVKVRALRDKVGMMVKESAIISAASALGFYNPRDAASMIKLSQIEVNEAGGVDEEVVIELIKELGESKPYMLKVPNEGMVASYGPTNPSPPKGNWPKPKLTTANQIEQLKQRSRELTRQGKVVEATRLFNRAWEMEYGLQKTGG